MWLKGIIKAYKSVNSCPAKGLWEWLSSKERSHYPAFSYFASHRVFFKLSSFFAFTPLHNSFSSSSVFSPPKHRHVNLSSRVMMEKIRILLCCWYTISFRHSDLKGKCIVTARGLGYLIFDLQKKKQNQFLVLRELIWHFSRFLSF